MLQSLSSWPHETSPGRLTDRPQAVVSESEPTNHCGPGAVQGHAEEDGPASRRFLNFASAHAHAGRRKCHAMQHACRRLVSHAPAPLLFFSGYASSKWLAMGWASGAGSQAETTRVAQGATSHCSFLPIRPCLGLV